MTNNEIKQMFPGDWRSSARANAIYIISCESDYHQLVFVESTNSFYHYSKSIDTARISFEEFFKLYKKHFKFFNFK